MACGLIALACTPHAAADETLIKKKSGYHAALRGKAVRVVPVTQEIDPMLLEPGQAPDCAYKGTTSNPATARRSYLVRVWLPRSADTSFCFLRRPNMLLVR